MFKAGSKDEFVPLIHVSEAEENLRSGSAQSDSSGFHEEYEQIPTQVRTTTMIQSK